jgi:hypothetical protein
VFTRNIITADEVSGTAIIDLSPSGNLWKRIFDHQTHDVMVELVPQGQLQLRLTMEGEEEDVNFWFKKAAERLERTRAQLLRILTSKIDPILNQSLEKAVKDNEPAPLPSTSFFTQFTASVEYSDRTITGKSVDSEVDESEAVASITPLIDYLEKNFSSICDQLELETARNVIGKLWNTTLSTCLSLAVPPLYGVVTQKRLCVRQISMLRHCVDILRDFFHGDGGEYGLSYTTLDNQLYKDLLDLFARYHDSFQQIREVYEISFSKQNDKPYLLRLMRLSSNVEDVAWLKDALLTRLETWK